MSEKSTESWLENGYLLVFLFWLAALADGLSTYAAVLPYGATLEHEVNPFLRGASWLEFTILLVFFHLIIQAWFSWKWPRRELINEMAPKGSSYWAFSKNALYRFLTIHIPDEIQVTYTGLTMYFAVLVAHLLAVVNNLCVAFHLSSGFYLIARALTRLRPTKAPEVLHEWSILLFYCFVILAGISAAHLWFVWFLRSDKEETIFDLVINHVPEGIYRFGGCLLFSACVVHKVTVRHTYANQMLWFLETSIFVALALFYLLREPARSLPTGMSETIIPLLGGVWPFFLLFTPRGSFGLQFQTEILLVMCFGTAIALWGYIYLNRAFTIMVEARVLKKGGPYQFVRHPVYTGQLITAFAVMAWRFSYVNVGLVLLFTVIQWYRAKLEEHKLAATFSEYGEYAKGTGMFLPGLGKWS